MPEKVGTVVPKEAIAVSDVRVFSSLLAFPLSAQTKFFVNAEYGSNTYSGTSGAAIPDTGVGPWKTVTHAMAQFSATPSGSGTYYTLYVAGRRDATDLVIQHDAVLETFPIVVPDGVLIRYDQTYSEKSSQGEDTPVIFSSGTCGQTANAFTFGVSDSLSPPDSLHGWCVARPACGLRPASGAFGAEEPGNRSRCLSRSPRPAAR